MDNIRSTYNGGTTSTVNKTDITSFARFDAISETDFSLTSKAAMDIQSRSTSLEGIRAQFMAVECDLTEEEIREECEIVRQQIYEKYVEPTRR